MNKVLEQMKNEFNRAVLSREIIPEDMEIEVDGLSAGRRKVRVDESNDVGESNSFTKLLANRTSQKVNKNKDTKDQKLIVKRSSRRRSIGNKSILQSAIARKERSFSDCNKSPKKASRQIKSKVDEKKNVAEINEPVLNSVDDSNVNRKRLKLVEQSFSCQKENGLRRSLRMISSEKEEAQKCLSDEELVKDYLEQYSLYRETSKLCCCLETKNIYSELDSKFCSAIDSFDEKLIGCSRLVELKPLPMYRSSTRIPFGVFCETHIQRLRKHNCCPSCGFFCTQGEFLQCKFKHYFHKDCSIQMEDKALCPHCGDFTNNEVVKIKVHSLKPPVFLPVQMPYHPSAKMTFEKTPLKSEKRIEDDEDSGTSSTSNIQEVGLIKCDKVDIMDLINGDSFNDIIKFLQTGRIDIRAKLAEFNDATLLHLAVLKGNLRMVQFLTNLQADLESMDNEQSTPLMLAVTENRNDILKYLLASGAQLIAKGTDGMTVLHLAAKCGNLEACRSIVSASFSIPNYVNYQDDGGWTPLVWACEHGHIDIVKYLISKGADIDLRDVEYNVALHWAAFGGHSDIVELLLRNNCNINILNVHGDTPLHICAREEKYDTVVTLLSRNANVFIINRNNETPLDCVSNEGMCYDAIASYIKKQRTYVNKKPKFIISNDISRGREKNPIQCYNDVDEEEEPRNYHYIKQNCVSSDNVRIDLKVSTVRSCSCEDRCSSLDCNCAQMSVKCWYDKDGKLLSEFNYYDPPLIFECNDMCGCNAILCRNRVVQKPPNPRFELFRTASKGWGVRALTPIAKGTFVCEYVGEILTDTEADHREDDSYLFDLDNKETESFCIDAKFYGNFARFINHSCEPNLNPIKIFIEHHDLRFPKIALFAKKDIAITEELSFDYGDKFWLVKYKSFTCDCGSSHCRYSKQSIGEILEKYQITNEVC
ncbi:histone-lysine N-methyltransferase G9a isoform X2 [Rhynchophorus ferrugineus]|uniref:histone-lysine N-methyltransferase G9a isoform X2 n=1 Tax=Rhynchophorus ferrugineus TaxID=354439 RepID=UPI003FCEBE81